MLRGHKNQIDETYITSFKEKGEEYAQRLRKECKDDGLFQPRPIFCCRGVYYCDE